MEVSFMGIIFSIIVEIISLAFQILGIMAFIKYLKK